tara:strand:+ start:225 stop:413 length:189 start_codon:yes stop_codon:yes gene_type:complete
MNLALFVDLVYKGGGFAKSATNKKGRGEKSPQPILYYIMVYNININCINMAHPYTRATFFAL